MNIFTYLINQLQLTPKPPPTKVKRVRFLSPNKQRQDEALKRYATAFQDGPLTRSQLAEKLGIRSPGEALRRLKVKGCIQEVKTRNPRKPREEKVWKWVGKLLEEV